MKFRVRHYTEYSYNDAVSTCYNRLCLTPRNLPGHSCLSSEISIVPNPNDLTLRTDFFGNNLAFFSLYKEHTRLRINANSIVEIHHVDNTEALSKSTESWKETVKKFTSRASDMYEIIEYTVPSTYVPDSDVVREFAAESFTDKDSLWSGCMKLMQRIHKTIEFKPGFTTINTPVETVLKLKKGVCQDLAHLMITCLRNLGIASRYVSGYLETLPPPGKERLVGADASHAWVSVYFPDHGWVEFDPTNNLIPSDKHIIVAYGRDYYDVAPIKGIVFNSGEQNLLVKVDVERIDE